jgi:hypothetical protein
MVKHALKRWSKLSFVYPSIGKMNIKSKLEELQKDSENHEITYQLQKDELNLQCSYQNVLRWEKDFWCLKSRSLWLKVGDKNTKFFHNQAKFKKMRNNVSKITLEDGTIVTEFAEIKTTTSTHFVKLYTQ